MQSTRQKRLVVTGRNGQAALSLMERSQQRNDFRIITVGRPELDLADPGGIEEIIRGARPDAVLSAAAYTQVDQAESEVDVARSVNVRAPGLLADITERLGIPIIHLSTDYVFDGTKAVPYVETDETAPLNVYGRTKCEGEMAVRGATRNHTILRTAWLYGPFGRNFAKTMLTVARDRATISVVNDQIGTPTSTLDLADAILAVARNLLESDADAYRGTFHATASGATSWAGFANCIFACSAARGGPRARVTPIASIEFPTPATRPAKSMLDCSRLLHAHGVRLPPWQDSVCGVVDRILSNT